MKKAIITTLEITATHIKLMQAKALRVGHTITHCDLREINDFSDEGVAALLKEMCALPSLDPQNLIFIIPRRFVILKHLSLPSQDDHELKRMLDLQIIDQVPYSREDIIYDYMAIGKEPSGYTKVLVIIVHKEVIQKYLNILNKADLTSHILTISSLGILNWYQHRVLKDKEKHEACELFLNLDVNSSEICFLQANKLLFSRNVNFGIKELTDAHLTSLLEQIKLTIQTFKNEKMGSDVEKMFIITALPEVDLLKIRVQDELKLPVNVLNPIEDLSFQKSLNLQPLLQSGLSLTSSLGFLITAGKKIMNFLPREILKQQKTRQVTQTWISFFSLLIVTCLLGLSILGVDLYHEFIYLQNLQKRIVQIKPQTKDAKERLDLLKFAKEELEGRILVVDILDQLYSLIPKEISLNLLSYTNEGSFIIQGLAESAANVNSFQNSLVNSPIFRDVTLQYVTKRKVLQKEWTDFKITCRLSRILH